MFISVLTSDCNRHVHMGCHEAYNCLLSTVFYLYLLPTMKCKKQFLNSSYSFVNILIFTFLKVYDFETLLSFKMIKLYVLFMCIIYLNYIIIIIIILLLNK